VLVSHSDCGAYGGLATTFDADARRERVFQQHELERAGSSLRAAVPGVEVTSCFMDFERVWLGRAEAGRVP
jgi:hypothetical protein